MKKLLVILILALTTSAWGYTVRPNISTYEPPGGGMTVYWYVNGVANDSLTTDTSSSGWERGDRYFDTAWTQTDACTRCWLLYKVMYASDTQYVGEYIDVSLAGEVADSVSLAGTDTTLIKTLATNNPSLFYGPTSSGSGVDTVNILALDTTGTDTALYLTKIVVKTMAGAVEGNLFTESGGQALFTLTTGDTFTVWGYKGGYVFDRDTIVVAAGMTDTANAYNAIIGTPSSADLCRVYAWAYDPQGNPIADATLTATLQGNSVRDTCNNTVIVKYENTSNPSDATGYLYVDLTKSKCFNKENKYLFQLTYPSGETINVGKQSVPDSSTYMLTW